MISRRTARVLADAYVLKFSSSHVPHRGYRHEEVYRDSLYDFLYEKEDDAWFCNSSKTLHAKRGLKEWVMKLHTGETQTSATPNWSWQQRQQLGQRILANLAQDFLNWFHNEADEWHRRQPSYAGVAANLTRNLELDGYTYKENVLQEPESDVLNIEEETGVLRSLYTDLKLDEAELAFACLSASEDHYLAGRWEDCIANARKFFELTLRQAAEHFSRHFAHVSLSDGVKNRPVAVRDFLESGGLLEKREQEAIGKVYGLLSHTGSHPYMAKSDQARLLRQLALTLAQFVLLRLQGRLASQRADAA